MNFLQGTDINLTFRLIWNFRQFETICLALLRRSTKHDENLIFCFFSRNLSAEYDNFRGIQVDMMYFLYAMFSPYTKVPLLAVMGLLPYLPKK